MGHGVPISARPYQQLRIDKREPVRVILIRLVPSVPLHIGYIRARSNVSDVALYVRHIQS